MESLPEDLREALLERFSPAFLENRLNKKLLRNRDFVLGLLKKPRQIHILATPLIEVVSVTISKNQDDGMLSEIYGSIQIVDGEGATFAIYNRTVDVPQTIQNGGTLMLSMPKDRAISPSSIVKMEIALKDRALKDRAGDDVEVVVGSRSWDFKSHDDYDTVKTETVNGVHSSAAVCYVAYRHAVFATVEVILLKGKEDGSCNSADVYGSVVAYYGNKCSTILFDKKQNESVKVEYKTCIELSKPVVAVPVWSSLMIHAKLWNHDTQQQIVDNGHEFCVMSYGGYTKDVEGQNDLIQVKVHWHHAHMQPPPVERFVEETSNVNIDNLLPVAKKHRVSPDQQSLLASSISRNFLSDLRKSLEQTDWILLEVFSVSVHNCNSDKEFNLWGKIKVLYKAYGDRFSLFDRDKSSPQRLLPNQTLAIAFPAECYVSTLFGVELDLKDVDGLDISYGGLEWSERFFEEPIPWYDRKLCSVVQGDNGYYAAVHYSIFSGGVQAAVKINLINKSSSMKYTKVDGTVCVQYSDYRYATIYDKEFYRRKLFVGHIEDPSLQYLDSKILLSESWVAVPKGSALIVDVNLKLISQQMDFPSEAKTDEMLKAAESFEDQLAVFKTEHKIETMLIEKTIHQIEISVEWSQASY